MKEIILRAFFFNICVPILVITTYSNAQVLNVDREFSEDTLRKKFDVAANLFLSSDKQKNNVFNISTSVEYDKYLRNKYLILALFKNDAVLNGKQIIQNEGFSQLRYRDNDHRKISPEFYFQYQWNGSWGMRYRTLAGTNVRLKIIEKEKGDIYAAIGTFYEKEKWNWDGVKPDLLPLFTNDITRSMFRLNTYLKVSRKLSKNIDISSTSYLQFPLQGKVYKSRWYMDVNLYVTATQKIEFIFHWDHLRDLNRLVPIDDFYYSYSMGFQVKL